MLQYLPSRYEIRRRVLQHTFDFLAQVGRPIGGFRPRRITNAIGDRGYRGTERQSQLWRWCQDRYGAEFWLHPAYFLDRQIIAYGAYEPQLHELIAKVVHSGDTCLDVGANIGLMSMHLARRVGASGALHCFEPHPKVRARLEENLRRNDCLGHAHVHGVALSDVPGTVRLHVMSDSDDNHGQSSIVGLGDECQLSEEVEVQARTVDDMMEEHGVSKIAFVKVDIQGAEPLFLRGGTGLFSRADAPLIAMEVSPGDLRHLGLDSRDLIRQLEGYGYGVYTLGRGGRRIYGKDVAPNFTAYSVVCRK